MDRHPILDISGAEVSTDSAATPPVDMVDMMDLVDRLKKLQFQVRELQDMITANQPCSAIAKQMASARKALDQTFYALVLRHTVNSKRASRIDEIARIEITRSAHLLDKLG